MKNLLKLPLLILALMLVVSCGDSKKEKEEEKKLSPLEMATADAKKSVKVACDYFKLVAEDDQEKIAELEKESKEYEDELAKKYGENPDAENGSASKEVKKAFWETLEAELNNCEAFKQFKNSIAF